MILQEELIIIANQLIEKSFSDVYLQQLAQSYVNFKFQQSLNFALLTELHYSIFREQQNLEEKRELQVIVEFIILAADILDDIQDEDVLIYPWSNVYIGENLNIIIGFLLTALHKVTLLNCSEEAKNFISQQIQLLLLKSINGQQKDMHNSISNEFEYLEMVSLKSGSLMQLACILGAGNVLPETLQMIKTYTNYLGIVAQIRNDVHDVLTDHTINDLHIKKVTLPILYYLCIEDSNFQPIKNYYNNQTQYMHLTESEKAILMDIVRNGGAIPYCHILEKIYYHKFQACINDMTLTSVAREQLLNINI